VQLLSDIVAKLGLAAKVSDETPRLLQRPGRTLQTHIHKHRRLFIRQHFSRAVPARPLWSDLAQFHPTRRSASSTG